MTDFYSVLKSSIVRRDLRSPADRREVYEQARDAMVRKLWSFEPPLSEDEIDARIGLFDDAVERIETDLERSLGSGEAPDRRYGRGRARQPARAQPPRRAPTTYGRRDEYADRAPVLVEYQPRHMQETRPAQTAYEDTSERDSPRGRDIARIPARAQPNRLHDERFAVASELDESDEAWFTDQHAQPRHENPPAPAYAEAPQYRQTDRGLPAYDHGHGESADDGYYHEEVAREEPYREPGAADTASPDAGGGYAYDDEPYRQSVTGDHGYQDQPHATQSEWDYASPAEAYSGDEFETHEVRYAPAARQTRRRRARKTEKRPRKTDKRPRRAGGSVGRVLAIIGGAVAVILIVFIAYIFLPIIFGSDPARQVADTSPPKSDDRLPIAGTATAAARIASDSSTATEIPERNLDVRESLVVFNGTDPTVFEGSSNNPIQFDSDTEGGFARISSATSAAGARAVIGPGLAEKLAGQTVRVTLLARSSSENGAAIFRFAYQSGLAISHWQNADLASNYSTYGIIWRVPATHTATGDYLLIEPGVPGDGTSTDIRLIKIDILAS